MTDRHPDVVHAPALRWIEPLSAPFGNGIQVTAHGQTLGYYDGEDE